MALETTHDAILLKSALYAFLQQLPRSSKIFPLLVHEILAPFPNQLQELDQQAGKQGQSSAWDTGQLEP